MTSKSPKPPVPGAQSRRVAVIGGGPAGLIAAETLAAHGCQVTVYERMPTVGRKLLIAGRGGLNLTHAEPFERFASRYGQAWDWLRPYLNAFPPGALVAWAQGLGQETFIGSSGRVFPKAMKASPLLRAWLRRLADQGVRVHTRARWLGWNAAGELAFEALSPTRPDATVLALGGASWPKLGADGSWVDTLAEAGVMVAPFRPANCGFVAGWSETFRERFAGSPLKSVALSFADRRVRGEAMITRQGLEGGAVYALSNLLRDTIERDGRAVLDVDLRPDLSTEQLVARLDVDRARQSLSTFLRKAARLAPPAIGLLREANAVARAEAMAPRTLAQAIKCVRVTLTASQGLARAISSAGGIARSEVDEALMLSARPGVFVAGEMLDWEAPTGGYLLQACFATGVAAANGALTWLDRRDEQAAVSDCV